MKNFVHKKNGAKAMEQIRIHAVKLVQQESSPKDVDSAARHYASAIGLVME